MRSRRVLAGLVLLLIGLTTGIAACGPEGASVRTPEATSYAFDATVTREQRAEIVAAVSMTSNWLANEAGLPLPEMRITAEPEGSLFLAGLAERYAVTDADADAIRATMGSAAGITVGHDIMLVVDGRWASLGAEKRAFVVAHEIFHVVQYVLASGRSASPAAGAVPGPAWLVEGSADYVAARVLADSGVMSFEDYVREYEARERNLPGRLRDLETVSTHAAWGAEGQYTLGFLATLQLTGNGGRTALFSLWRYCADGASWEVAFKRVFGQSVSSFYVAFDDRPATRSQN